MWGPSFAVAMLTLAGCSATTTGGADAGLLEASTTCASASDCDDGTFCNGAARCAPGSVGADARGCVPGALPCTGLSRCDEASDACSTDFPDADGDGHRVDDCDDGDPNRFPGNAEVCDAADHDEDCDLSTFGVRDLDGDHEPDVACCNVATGGTPICGQDCDDTRADVHHGAGESCDGIDQDCDTAIDETLTSVSYAADCDGDLYGAGAVTAPSCAPPVGTPATCHGVSTARWADNATDCDDADASIHPGLTDACDGLDNDCSGAADEGCDCTDGAMRACGHAAAGLCRPGTQSCIAGAWQTGCAGSVDPRVELCSSDDENCNGQAYDGFACGGPGATTPAASRDCTVCQFIHGNETCSGTCEWSRVCDTGISDTEFYFGADSHLSHPSGGSGDGSPSGMGWSCPVSATADQLCIGGPLTLLGAAHYRIEWLVIRWGAVRVAAVDSAGSGVIASQLSYDGDSFGPAGASATLSVELTIPPGRCALMSYEVHAVGVGAAVYVHHVQVTRTTPIGLPSTWP